MFFQALVHCLNVLPKEDRDFCVVEGRELQNLEFPVLLYLVEHLLQSTLSICTPAYLSQLVEVVIQLQEPEQAQGHVLLVHGRLDAFLDRDPVLGCIVPR